MTQNEIQGLLASCSFADLELTRFGWIVGNDDGRCYLQIIFDARDNDHQGVLPKPQTGRKWFLSPHMTKSELVRTLFMAILAVVEHETRELFTYKNTAIFGPHIDIEALRESCSIQDKRPEPA